MVKMCAENIATDYVFLSTRTKFSTDNFSFLYDDAEALSYKLRSLIDSFDGVVEKF